MPEYTPVTDEQLIRDFANLRWLQKNYFATRGKNFLVRSKDLEAKVDAHLKARGYYVEQKAKGV